MVSNKANLIGDPVTMLGSSSLHKIRVPQRGSVLLFDLPSPFTQCSVLIKSMHAFAVSHCFALLDFWNYFLYILSTDFMFSSNRAVTVTD